MLQGGHLGTLGRLFAIGVDVAVADIEDLPTVYPEDLLQAGLVRERRGRVEPLVAIDGLAGGTTPVFVVSDRLRPGDTSPDADFVGGPTASMETIQRLIPGRARGRVLDAGCRAGGLAVLLARSRDAVVATEAPGRAASFARFNIAFNQATNIDLRSGGMYDTVVGEDFDLIVSDRPRVVALDRSTEHVGVPADRSSRDAVVGAGSVLRPGGWAVITAQWALGSDESAEAHIEEWLAGSRCDAMVIDQGSESSDGHVAARLRPLGRVAPNAARELYDRWTVDLADQKVSSVGHGLVVLRRREAGEPWLTVRPLPNLPPRDLTGALATLFQNQDWLSARPEPGRMLDEALRLPAGVLVRPASRVDNGRWILDGATAEAATGIFSGGRLSDSAAAVLGRCDGRRPLGHHFDEVYGDQAVKPPGWDQSVEAARRDVDEVARRMVGMGLLVVPASQ
jgi:SAM-dependent methyltransferase